MWALSRRASSSRLCFPARRGSTLMRNAPICLVLSFLAACGFVRSNPYDPQGTGVKKPGRIKGSVVVVGRASNANLGVHAVDAQGVRLETIQTDSDGAFLTQELTPGTYTMEVEVPLG